jgi:2,4-dienoyl-CoA reductase-like NADH-dependent reductase (Old Yellow Enzyme family)/3-methyladenine DNA glycosylase/8-oxoguanine DNA glycosylase
VIKAATYEKRARDGLVTRELIDFHTEYAAGGVGMTTVAHCAVSPEGRTDGHQIHWRAEALPGLRTLTDAVHARGAAVAAQIGHSGPVGTPRLTGGPTLSPSRFFSPRSLRFTRSATRADIDRVVRAHGAAARMAVEAGFDAVEVHLGHNYLASSFLSPRLNRRRDDYGGPLANRARLAMEITRAVRDAVGDRVAIIAKLNLDDGVPGGFWLDEAVVVAQWLAESGTVDALEMTAGSSLLNPMYLFRGDAPVREFAAAMPEPLRTGIRLAGRFFVRRYPYQDGYLLDDARQIRAAVDLPMILLGGVTSRAIMDRAMADGFQFVAMARALLREPNLVDRMRAQPATRSLCNHNNRCTTTIFGPRTRCVLVPENGSRSAETAPAGDPRERDRRTIRPRGPFDLSRSLGFLEAWPVTRQQATDGVLRFAFCAEHDWQPVGVRVTQPGAGVDVETTGQDVSDQVARILSLDVDATPVDEIARRDPVVAQLVRAAPGLRPVCFWTPWEAACWAVLSQRTSARTASAVRQRISEEFGTPVVVDGTELATFPAPRVLLDATALPGVDQIKLDRIHALAAAALDGTLTTHALRGAPADDAIAALRQLPGVGPFSAALILIRGAGAPDVFTTTEARLLTTMRAVYHLPDTATDDDYRAIADNWRPLRSWVSFWLRSAAKETLDALAVG